MGVWLARLAAPLACAAACGSQGTATTSNLAAPGAAELQAPQPTREARAQELLQAAQLQIGDLEMMRVASTARVTAVTIDTQIAAISQARDEVLADLTEPESARVDADLVNLQQVMQNASAVAPRATIQPPIPPGVSGPGRGQIVPPVR